MKLAESLIIRSELQSKLLSLKERLIRSAKVQEGDDPPEKPSLLLKELEKTTDELINIIQKISKTNNATVLSSGKTLSDTLAQRDVLTQKRKILNSLIESAGSIAGRYSMSEIRMISTVDVAQLQKQADELSRNIRELDTAIQEKNWLTELQ